MALLKIFGHKKKTKTSKKALKKSMAKRKVQPRTLKKVEKAIIREVKIEKLPDDKAFEMLKRSRVSLAPYEFCKNEKELSTAAKRVGFPCVLKISGNVIHKTEVGGVRTNIQNQQQALETFRQLVKIKGTEKVIVQKQMSGTELIVGSKKDSQFGSVIVVGFGGIYVEVLKDVVFRVCPITIKDAEEMVRELKGFDILKGTRGQKPINFLNLYDTLIRVSKFVISQKIKELDINPLFCNEQGCFAADVRIVK